MHTFHEGLQEVQHVFSNHMLIMYTIPGILCTLADLLDMDKTVREWRRNMPLVHLLTLLYENPVLIGWSTKIMLLFTSHPYSDLFRLKSSLIW